MIKTQPTRNTDIIRKYNKDYLKVTSKNSLIKQRVGTIADNVYSFQILFGAYADKKTTEEMEDTFWLCGGNSEDCYYDEDVEIVTY